MTRLETAINTLEHISTTTLPAAQMRRIIRDILLQQLYPERNRIQIEAHRNQTGVKGS